MTSNPEVVGQLLKSMYVDDVISGAQDEQQAELLYLESKILKDGGFNLRKFVTNSDTLQQQINASDPTKEQPRRPPAVSHSEETYSKSTLGVTQPVQSGEQKGFGSEVGSGQGSTLLWIFRHCPSCSQNGAYQTKSIVSVVGKFYDPIGFLSPIVIKFKILFQDLCEGKNNLDQPLTGELLRKSYRNCRTVLP